MSKNGKNGAGPLILIASICLVIWIAMNCSVEEDTDTKKQGENATSRTDVSDEIVDNSVDQISAPTFPYISEQLETLGLPQGNAQAFIDCGISDIQGAEIAVDNRKYSGLISYRIVYDEERTLTFTFENDVLIYIGLNGTDLYTDEDGFLCKLEDVHIPETHVSFETAGQLQTISIDVVNKFLNYPSSADYHTFGWAYGREDNNYVCKGEVTASNAFGVKERMVFYVYFVNDSKKNEITPTKVIIDGKAVYQK